MYSNADPKKPYVSPYLKSASTIQLKKRVQSATSISDVKSTVNSMSRKFTNINPTGPQSGDQQRWPKVLIGVDKLQKAFDKLNVEKKDSGDGNYKSTTTNDAASKNWNPITLTSPSKISNNNKVRGLASNQNLDKNTTTLQSIRKPRPQTKSERRKPDPLKSKADKAEETSNTQQKQILKPILKSISQQGMMNKSHDGKNKSKPFLNNSGPIYDPRRIENKNDISLNLGKRFAKKVSFYDKVSIHPVPYESRGSTEWQHNLLAREHVFQSLFTDPRLSYLTDNFIQPTYNNPFGGSDGLGTSTSRIRRR